MDEIFVRVIDITSSCKGNRYYILYGHLQFCNNKCNSDLKFSDLVNIGDGKEGFKIVFKPLIDKKQPMKYKKNSEILISYGGGDYVCRNWFFCLCNKCKHTYKNFTIKSCLCHDCVN